MHQTGALIVESSKVLLPALAAASRLVSGVLYVPLAYDTHSTPPGHTLAAASRDGLGETNSDRAQNEVWNLYETMQQIRHVYFQISRQCPLLDVRILLPQHISEPFKSESSSTALEYGDLDVLLSSIPTFEEVKRSPGYLLLANRIKSGIEMRFESIRLCDSDCSSNGVVKSTSATATPTEGATTSSTRSDTLSTFSNVAMGGTFDNIHNGHRLMLAQSALLARQRLVVGVSSGDWLATKVLTELIKPVEVSE
jgi:hypothetical protein